MADDAEDKTEEPSARKLEEARKKGNVAKSPDLAPALSLIGACLVIAFYGPSVCNGFVTSLMPYLAQPHQMLDALESGGGASLARHLMIVVGPPMILLMSGAIVLGVAGNLLQTGLMLTPSKLKPDVSRLSIFKGFNRLFGIDAIVTFFKTLAKLSVISLIVYNVSKPLGPEVVSLAAMSPMAILPFTLKAFIAIAVSVCLFLFLGSGLDYLWQRFRFMQKMRMSKQEQKEEHRQSEGDPHVKARLRQIRNERSKRRMMANVRKATVIITNPTHYAVALQYEGGDQAAPICVAKGMDAIALKIREEAGLYDIPIVEDPPLARALYASIEIDEVISREHFAAVSKIIGFVMSRRKRGF